MSQYNYYKIPKASDIRQGIIIKGLENYHTEEMILFGMKNIDGFKQIKIPRDYDNASTRGCAFVEFGDIQQAINARQKLNHTLIYGKQITVSLVVPDRQNLNKNNFLVANIPMCSESEFEEVCSQYGYVLSSKLVYSNDKQQVKFGYVSFFESDAGNRFLNSEVKFNDNTLMVQPFLKNKNFHRVVYIYRNHLTEDQVKDQDFVSKSKQDIINFLQPQLQQKITDKQYTIKVDIKPTSNIIVVTVNNQEDKQILQEQPFTIDKQILGIAKDNCIYLKDYIRKYNEGEWTQDEESKVKSYLESYLSQDQPLSITVGFSGKDKQPYAFVSFQNNVQADQCIERLQQDKEFHFNHQNIQKDKNTLLKKTNERTHLYMKNIKETVDQTTLLNVLQQKIPKAEVKFLTLKSHPNYPTKFATIVTKTPNKLDILRKACNKSDQATFCQDFVNLFHPIPKLNYLYPKEQHRKHVNFIHNNTYLQQPMSQQRGQFMMYPPMGPQPGMMIPQMPMPMPGMGGMVPPGLNQFPQMPMQAHFNMGMMQAPQRPNYQQHQNNQHYHQHNRQQQQYEGKPFHSQGQGGQRYQNRNNNRGPKQYNNNNQYNKQRFNNQNRTNSQGNQPQQQHRGKGQDKNYNNNKGYNKNNNNNNNNNRQTKSQPKAAYQPKEVQQQPKKVIGKIETAAPAQPQQQQVTIESIASKWEDFKKIPAQNQIYILGQVLLPLVQRNIKKKENINQVIQILLDLENFTIDEIKDTIQNQQELKERINEAETLLAENQ